MHNNASPADVPPLPYVPALKDISPDMPAFPRAYALSSKAYEVGFRWEKAQQAFKKIGTELKELKEALKKKDRENTIEEMGDVLSAIVTLVVFQKIDAAVLSNIHAASAQSGGTDLMTTIDESLAKVGLAVDAGNKEHTQTAIGQLLADIAAFAASQEINPEKALQRTNDKFTYRFNMVEAELHAEGLKMTDLDLLALVKRWDKYKLIPESLIR